MKLIYSFSHKLPVSGEVVELAIRKPTRAEIDETDMVYSQFVSECVQRGILTRDMMAKVVKNFGGTMSESETKEYYRLVENFLEVSKKLEKTKNKKEIEALEKERLIFFTAIKDIEDSQEQAIFSKTADVIARNKTIVFLAITLAVKKTKEGYESLYIGRDFEEKYEHFSELEDADWDDAHSILNHLSSLVAFWYFGDRGLTEDDIRAYDALTEFFTEVKSGEPDSTE